MARESNKREAEKKSKFIKRFAYHRDPVDAAREAGYTNPTVASRRLLKDKFVQQRVSEITEKAVEYAGVNTAFVLSKLVRVVDYGMQEVEAFDSKGRRILLKDGTDAVKLMNSKAALEALEHLGRYLGMYKENVEVTNVLDLEALESARRRVIEMEAVTEGIEWKPGEVLEADGGEA